MAISFLTIVHSEYSEEVLLKELDMIIELVTLDVVDDAKGSEIQTIALLFLYRLKKIF